MIKKMSLLILNLLKQVGLNWSRQVVFTICIIVGTALLMLLYLGWDARFISNRDLLANLERRYGQEFTLLSTRSLKEAERVDDVWRVKVFELAPTAAPEQRFWAFNIITGESGGLFGASNGLLDTYDAQIMLAAFAERAAQADLEYELTYRSYPCRESTEFYSEIYVNIELTDWDRLPEACELIAASAIDALAQLPAGYNYYIGVDFVFNYREAEWPADKFYPLQVTPFAYGAAEPTAANIQSEIESEFAWYSENYDIWKKLNK